MTRQFILALALAGTAVLLSAPAQAVSPLQCENRAANCIGSCTNYTAGAGDYGGRQNKCMAACDRRVTIPMKLGTDSLNVSIAAALFLYHFTQERPSPDDPGSL